MISRGEDVEAQALKNRGWSISPLPVTSSGIRRRSGPTRAGSGRPVSAGARYRTRSSPTKAYLGARFGDNVHIWATAMFDEVSALSYTQPYVSFARQLRLAELRPPCEAYATRRASWSRRRWIRSRPAPSREELLGTQPAESATSYRCARGLSLDPSKAGPWAADAPEQTRLAPARERHARPPCRPTCPGAGPPSPRPESDGPR